MKPDQFPTPAPKINFWILLVTLLISVIPTGYLILITFNTSRMLISLAIAVATITLSIWTTYLFNKKQNTLPQQLRQTYQKLLTAKQNLEQQTINLVRNALSINEYRNKLEDRNVELLEAKNDLEKQNIILTKDAEKLKKYQIQLEARNQQLQQALEKTRQLSDSLASEKQQMEIMLQSLTDGIIAVNQQNQIILFNTASEQITGINKQQVFNKNIDEMIKLYNKEAQLIPLSGYTNQTEEEIARLWNNGLIYKSGQDQKYLAITAAPVKFTEPGNTGWIITLHDKTKEHQLEAMKLDFVSMAAHELRTPLTTIQGYISMLQQPESVQKLDQMEQDILNRAAGSAKRLNELIENLLIVSKIEKTGINLSFETVQLDELAQKAVKEYEILAQEKNLQLIYMSSSQSISPISADPSRLNEVFSNLIGNAIKYTDQGKITVTVKQDQQQLIASVIDTGKGIPKEALTHLFTKFFRVKNDLIESKTTGTGLGLYISKNIIQAHKGNIWVESELGKGSAFFFSLPINSSLEIKSNSIPQSNFQVHGLSPNK
jgi:PAS domain S-box-containing protein